MIKNIPALLEKVKKEIQAKTDIAVVGLSGGADSTLVATLCVLALGKENVWGVHMPYSTLDVETFNSRSVKLAKHLGINQITINISNAVDSLTGTITKELRKLSMVNQGNMRSRMRMISLYTFNCHLAEQSGKRCRVMGTGNASEDIIGYDTLGGDQMADLFVIGTLFKSEVYQLLEYFVAEGVIKEEHIDRVPSAGLWEGQTDQKELGYSYNEMEPSVRRYLVGKQDMNNPIDKFVVERHLANKHKHEARPVLNLSEFSVWE